MQNQNREGPEKMLLDLVRDVSTKARMYQRVLQQTGLLARVRPRGAVVALRTLASGSSGPSAIFRIQAANNPDVPAFVFDGRTSTYAEVDARIDRLGTAMRRRGFKPGDAAMVMVKNRPESIEIGAAMSRIGASGVAVSWRSTPAELAYLGNHSGARALFFDAEFWPTVEAALEKLPNIPRENLFPVGGSVAGLTNVDELFATRAESGLGGSEGTVIIYTSGTTGKPKGAVRRFARGQLEGFFAFIGETPMRVGDRHLCVCPLYHSTGLGFAGMALMLGGTVYIQREFDPEDFLATIERERITTAAVVPTLLHRLMALPDEVFERYDTFSLRALFCGGAQLPGALAQRTQERLGGVLYNFYGATETGLVTVATPDELRRAPGTIGHAIPGCTVHLLDDQGRPVARGAVGELYVQNTMLVAGYHDDDAATQASMRAGMFSVGDLAMQDSNGLFHVVGRQRDMVISGGVNIYPAEIEAVVAEHPGVAQVAVIGIPDDEWGERLRAFVVPKHGVALDAAEMRGHCRARLAGPKIPREWVFTDALPSNPTGKILKRELKHYDGAVERA